MKSCDPPKNRLILVRTVVAIPKAIAIAVTRNDTGIVIIPLATKHAIKSEMPATPPITITILSLL